MPQRNYIRERHYYPTVPTQEALLLPYSNDTPENIKKLNRLYNLFTNFEGSDIFDATEELPPMYGVANVHYTSDKNFNMDISGNTLTIGPGIALMADVVVDITGSNTITITDNTSWSPPSGLTYDSYHVYPPSLDYTGSSMDIIVSLFRFEDSSNQDTYFMLSTPYAFYSNTEFREQSIPLNAIRLTLDSSDNITAYEFLDLPYSNTGQPVVYDVDDDDKIIKYKSFPHFKLFRADGGYPHYG